MLRAGGFAEQAESLGAAGFAGDVFGAAFVGASVWTAHGRVCAEGRDNARFGDR